MNHQRITNRNKRDWIIKKLNRTDAEKYKISIPADLISLPLLFSSIHEIYIKETIGAISRFYRIFSMVMDKEFLCYL